MIRYVGKEICTRLDTIPELICRKCSRLPARTPPFCWGGSVGLRAEPFYGAPPPPFAKFLAGPREPGVSAESAGGQEGALSLGLYQQNLLRLCKWGGCALKSV